MSTRISFVAPGNGRHSVTVSNERGQFSVSFPDKNKADEARTLLERMVREGAEFHFLNQK